MRLEIKILSTMIVEISDEICDKKNNRLSS